jgi:hypothetical protein
MHTKSILSTALVALASVASVQGKDRKFMIKNNCLETVWPGIFNSAAPAVPITGPLGFALTPGTYKEITVSDHWGGRIWPRTGCKKTKGGFHCATGDCGGTSEVCDPIKTGEPCTLGEWTLATENPPKEGPFVDWYDLSLVDGESIFLLPFMSFNVLKDLLLCATFRIQYPDGNRTKYQTMQDFDVLRRLDAKLPERTLGRFREEDLSFVLQNWDG